MSLADNCADAKLLSFFPTEVCAVAVDAANRQLAAKRHVEITSCDFKSLFCFMISYLLPPPPPRPPPPPPRLPPPPPPKPPPPPRLPPPILEEPRLLLERAPAPLKPPEPPPNPPRLEPLPARSPPARLLIDAGPVRSPPRLPALPRSPTPPRSPAPPRLP